MTGSGFFIPEIHDVSGSARGCLSAMLALLPAAAQEVAAVLVVPRWRGEHSLTACRELVAELRDLPGEKVLHGFTHSLGPSAWNRLVYGTENESEFARCSETEAERRLVSACQIFGEAFGHAPRWFCAPRWQEGRETTRALRRLGIRGRMLRKHYVLGDEQLSIEALWFDDGSRAVTRRLATRLRGRRLRSLLKDRHPFRLVLHPRDLDVAPTRREIGELVAELTGEGWQAAGLPALSAA